MRIRNIVFNQNKIAVCDYFGTFAPIGLLDFEQESMRDYIAQK